MNRIKISILHRYLFVGLLLIPAFVTGQQTSVSYIPDKDLVRNIILENGLIKYELTLDKGVHLTGATDKSTGLDHLQNNPDLLFISQRIPWHIIDVGFQLFQVEEERTGEHVTIRIRQQSTYVENPFIIIQEFSLDQGYELDWKATIINTATGGRAYHEPMTMATRITFPVMQKLRIGNEPGMHYLFPTQHGYFCIDDPSDFIFYFTRDYDPKMPIDIYNTEEDRGIYFHILDSPMDFNFENKEDFLNRVFVLTQEPGDTTLVLDCRIGPHKGDWHAAFDAFKKHIRSSFDFTYYERPVQELYRQRLISHFTFLYGLDIYDPEKNVFRIDRFLDEGEQNFGGYDYMLLWHDYQRMGIDNRDQFDMYEDLPGGLEGLREMVENAQARDVQVFIPYKPWDIMKGRTDRFIQEARIAKAIKANGIFLDTMSESDSTFRDALDAVSRDIVFVSEGRPDLAAAEMVTGSWNQSGNATNKMPNVDLFRFIIPEHNVHNINRMARKRDALIHNALFNGTGLIIWEDIFGDINRFSWNERILIKRYSRIIHENRDAFLTNNPIPLVADLRDDLYVNAYPIEEKCVYPAYQLGRENVSRANDDRLIGPFMEVSHPVDWHYVDVWNHQNIPVVIFRGKRCLVFPEEPTDVISCIIGMPENLKVQKEEETLRIEVNQPMENTTIQINTVNNLTLLEEEVLTLPGSGGEVDLSQLNLKFPYKVLIKLMQGDVLKDELILNLGWKKI